MAVNVRFCIIFFVICSFFLLHHKRWRVDGRLRRCVTTTLGSPPVLTLLIWHVSRLWGCHGLVRVCSSLRNGSLWRHKATLLPLSNPTLLMWRNQCNGYSRSSTGWWFIRNGPFCRHKTAPLTTPSDIIDDVIFACGRLCDEYTAFFHQE